MPVYDRQVGTTQDMVDIFIQDATVSTGFGLANLTISSFSSYYHRSDMTSTSSMTLVSTGTLGTWSSGQFLQINSTFMRGWYQLCVPNGVFANGSTCAVHMYGNPQMAPLPLLFNLTRFNPQRYVSSEPHNITRIYSDPAVTTAAGVWAVGAVGVSSFDIRVGVSSFGLRVGVSSIDQRVGVSSFGLPVGVSSISVPVSVTSLYGDPLVTSAAGTVAVGRVGVSSFGLPVGISSFGLPVGISSMQVSVDAQIVDRFLNRNVSSGADGGRTVREAFYVLRNRSEFDRAASTLVVYNTDDTQSSYQMNVTTTAGDPISAMDPS